MIAIKDSFDKAVGWEIDYGLAQSVQREMNCAGPPASFRPGVSSGLSLGGVGANRETVINGKGK
jgi:hypothetical protein